MQQCVIVIILHGIVLTTSTLCAINSSFALFFMNLYNINIQLNKFCQGRYLEYYLLLVNICLSVEYYRLSFKYLLNKKRFQKSLVRKSCPILSGQKSAIGYLLGVTKKICAERSFCVQKKWLT